jgi:hypothetical protein
VSDLDVPGKPDQAAHQRDLDAAIRQSRRTSWVILGIALFVVAGLTGAIFYVLGLYHRQLAREDMRQVGICQLAASIGTAHLVVPKGQRAPDELEVLVVLDLRVIYTRQHCGRPLPLDPDLLQWAVYYHLVR